MIKKRTEDTLIVYKPLSNKKYTKEKEIENLIMRNAKEFCEINFDDELLLAEQNKHTGRGQKRIDVLLTCRKHIYIVEIKNDSKSNSANRNALGQLLDYSLDIPNAKLVLLTTYFEQDIYNIIRTYNLPIQIIFLAENQCMVLRDYDKEI